MEKKSEYERLQKRITKGPIFEKIALADKLYSEAKYDNAIEILNEALKMTDKSFEFDICEMHRKLGNCYYAQSNRDEARKAYEKTLDYCTTNSSIYAMLAYLYYYVDNDIAIKYYSKVLELKPTDEISLSGKALTMLKSHNYTQQQLKEAFEYDIETFRSNYQPSEEIETFQHSPEKLREKKRLHIGYLSSDFCCHAMMQFILPLLEYHHKDKFDFSLFSTTKKSDYVTERIKQTGMIWNDCSKMTNEQLAKFIYCNNVDILVDLGGFTHCRSFALIYKPAPIQMQYLGFVNTLGIPEIDYIFADEFTIPKSSAKNYTEKPLYLGTFMQRFCFNNKNQQLPNLNELPYHKNGYITFGSFNCTSKLNDYTIELWSKLLNEVPNSKLLVYRTQMTTSIIERLKNKFEALGIPSSRLIFNNIPCKGSHFQAYQLADIGLDPTPFNGLTITIEAISMGLPILTLTGESMQSRGCARVNKALKLDNLIAENENEYIQRGIKLSKDIKKLDYYRKNLRNILFKSELMKDLDGFATHVENAYLKAWKEYCI